MTTSTQTQAQTQTQTQTNIKTLYGFRYDADKLGELYEKIDDAWGQIDIINQTYDDIHGGADHYTVCNLCGRVIVHDHNGYGSKCYQTIIKMLSKISKLDNDMKLKLDNYNLLKWGIYANTIKRVYIAINSKDDGTPKKFRNEFKKSFFKSISENQSGHFSRKQVDIMLKDLKTYAFYNSDFSRTDFDNKNDTIHDHATFEDKQKIKEAWQNIIKSSHVDDFTRITYIKAWIDNPFNNDEYINIELD